MAKVRLADIAAQVGVSTVTVHNALTGQKGVSDELSYRKWRQSWAIVLYLQPVDRRETGCCGVSVS